MQVNFIKDLVSSIVGKDGEKAVDVLYKKKNVNEFLISKKLGLTINQTRNLLYRLSDHGLVQFIRKKDSKKGGWYTYFWTLNIERSFLLLEAQINKKVSELEEQLEKRKNERFYYSSGSGLEYTEDEALENNFICPETGEVLELKDNKEEIDELEIKISKLKILIEEVKQEAEIIEKKRQIGKERKFKAEKKKKEKERKEKRAKNKREKEKSQRLPEKKEKKKKAIKRVKLKKKVKSGLKKKSLKEKSIKKNKKKKI